MNEIVHATTTYYWPSQTIRTKALITKTYVRILTIKMVFPQLNSLTFINFVSEGRTIPPPKKSKQANTRSYLGETDRLKLTKQ